MSEVSGKVRELEWTADHGVAGLGPYRLFEAITPLGRFTYGTDAEGSSWWSFQHGGIFTVGDEAAAKRQAEASWAKMAIAECAKCIVPSPAPDVNGGVPDETVYDACERIFGGTWTEAQMSDVRAALEAAIATAEASRRSPDLTAVMGEVEKELTAVRMEIDVEHGRLVGDDGYNYAAGVEFGLRTALIRIDTALSRIRSMKEPSDADAK